MKSTFLTTPFSVKEALALIKEQIHMFIGERRAVRLRDHFNSDLGMDSLDLVELVTDLEHQLKICLPEEVGEVENVKQLTSKIFTALKAKKRLI